jgi:hypothetical protein
VAAAAIVDARLVAFMAFRARKCSLMLAVRIHLISAVCLFDHGLILTVTRSANIQIAAGFQFVVGSMTICALHTSGNMSVSEIRACVSSKSSRPSLERKKK